MRTASKSRPTSTVGGGASRGNIFVTGCSATSGIGSASLMLRPVKPSGTTNGAPGLASR